jgi:hypothetical protein
MLFLVNCRAQPWYDGSGEPRYRYATNAVLIRKAMSRQVTSCLRQCTSIPAFLNNCYYATRFHLHLKIRSSISGSSLRKMSVPSKLLSGELFVHDAHFGSLIQSFAGRISRFTAARSPRVLMPCARWRHLSTSSLHSTSHTAHR